MYPILPDSHPGNYKETPFDADIKISRNGNPEEIQRKLEDDGGFYGEFITGEPFNDGDVLELEVSVDGFPAASCTTVVPVRPSVELLSYSFEGTGRFDCNMKISRSDATRYFGFRLECRFGYDEYIDEEYAGRYVRTTLGRLSVPGFIPESRNFVMPFGPSGSLISAKISWTRRCTSRPRVISLQEESWNTEMNPDGNTYSNMHYPNSG